MTKTLDRITDIAKIAFNAYGDRANWKTWDNRDMPTWDQLGDEIQERWIVAVSAVMNHLHEAYIP